MASEKDRLYLEELLEKLDFLLTGGKQTDDQSSFDFQKWLFLDPYYLSDGGYSRVYCDVFTGHIFLDSVSREEVKEKWELEEVKKLREEIEKSTRELYSEIIYLDIEESVETDIFILKELIWSLDFVLTGRNNNNSFDFNKWISMDSETYELSTKEEERRSFLTYDVLVGNIILSGDSQQDIIKEWELADKNTLSEVNILKELIEKKTQSIIEKRKK